MNWVCPRCKTINEGSVRICMVCDYDKSYLERRERIEKLLHHCQKLPVYISFSMIILAIGLISLNIVRIEMVGSVIRTVESRVMAVAQGIKLNTLLNRSWCFVPSIERMMEVSQRISYLYENLTGQIALGVNSRVSHFISLAVKNWRDCGTRIEHLIQSCLRTVGSIHQ